MATTFSYYQDSTGQWWAFSISPTGEGQTVAVSAPTPGPSPVAPTTTASTITLLDTMEWAKRFISNRSTAIGNFLEPSITSATIVMQSIITAPFRWRWNRKVTGFITVAGQQDYYLFNWSPSTPVGVGWVLVDNNGNCQTVTTAGTTGTFYPSFNATEGGSTEDGTSAPVAWFNVAPLGVTSSPTYDFGWIETTSVQDTSDKWFEITEQICLGSDSSQARPRNISAQGDDGSGNISFRLMPVPDAAYPVAITIQQTVPPFTSVNQTWAPIPDTYSDIFSWGFLALMFLFSDDPRFQLANQKFVTGILGENQGLDQSQVNIFLNNWQQVTGAPVANAQRQQQGNQARAV